MDEAKKQLIDKLKGANNVLVTVGRDPSVDQLAALLGLTLYLNKQGKHAAAVFSGEVPSTLEFLKPEETIEKNTDSLRDFIIALDKTKADKLRYKVEDDVVRIFITPYKTSISQDDFEFSQGDFNVDMVVTLGVQNQDDLDEAILSHGRILHDAIVASINASSEGGIGTINWHDPATSSLSELVCSLIQEMDATLLDEQISTAILTGIVAETDRFSNEKTTALTMSASAALMAAGANQQLVASKLQEPDGGFGGEVKDVANDNDDESDQQSIQPPKDNDGTLEIDHDADKDEQPELELPEPDENAPDLDVEESTDEDSGLSEDTVNEEKGISSGPKLITEPPRLGGTLTSNINEEALDPSTDPLSIPASDEPKILSHKNAINSLPSEPDVPGDVEESKESGSEPDKPAEEPPIEDDKPTPKPLPPAPEPEAPLEPTAPAVEVPKPEPLTDTLPAPATDKEPYDTLAELEESVGSPHSSPAPTPLDDKPTPKPLPPAPEPEAPLEPMDAPAPEADEAPAPNPLDTASLDAARDEVSRALNEAAIAGNVPPEPIQALSAQPMAMELNSPLHPQPSQVISPTAATPASNPLAMQSPLNPTPLPVQSPQDNSQPQSGPQVVDPTAPPPVPPPIPFQFGQQPPK